MPGTATASRSPPSQAHSSRSAVCTAGFSPTKSSASAAPSSFQSTRRSKSSRVLANARRATGLAHNDTEESLERLLTESWPRRRPFAQFATAFVTYLRRFAQGITTLTALEGEWHWKQSGAVQSRLELLDRRLEWLEEQVGKGAHSASGLWPEPGLHDLQPPIPLEDHPGERQLERLERQAGVLHRQLLSLRDHGWIPGATRV